MTWQHAVHWQRATPASINDQRHYRPRPPPLQVPARFIHNSSAPTPPHTYAYYYRSSAHVYCLTRLRSTDDYRIKCSQERQRKHDRHTHSHTRTEQALLHSIYGHLPPSSENFHNISNWVELNMQSAILFYHFCLSVCPSHCSSVSKQMHISVGLNFFYNLVWGITVLFLSSIAVAKF